MTQTGNAATQRPEEIFARGGEMGALMQSFDWEKTPLGAVQTWSQELRIALQICLQSCFPIVIYWGEDLTLLYNDAWRPFLGNIKQAHALGSPCREVWVEIWDVVGPQLQQVMTTGESLGSEDLQLLMNRSGDAEETYFTYSYSPILSPVGQIKGVFNVATETTHRILQKRRLETLRELASHPGQATTIATACQTTLQVLTTNPADFPFAAIYLVAGDRARLTATTPNNLNSPLLPPSLDLPALGLPAQDLPQTGDRSWLTTILNAQTSTVIDLPPDAALPTGSWPIPPKQALVHPLFSNDQQRIGILILGLNPYRPLDQDLQSFLTMTTGSIETAIAKAQDDEHKHQAEAELRESEARYRHLFEHNPQPMWIYDHQTLAFLDVNEAAIRHYGYSKAEFLAMTIQDIRPLEDVPALLSLVSQSDEHLTNAGIWRHRKKDGSLIRVEITTCKQQFANRPAMLVLLNDVTEQLSTLENHQRAESALRQSEEIVQQQLAEIELIYSSAPIGLCFIDTSFRFIRVNQRLAEINGRSIAHHLGKTLTEVLPGMAQELMPLYQQVIQTGMPLEALEVHGMTIADPGVERDWLISLHPFKSPNGTVLGINTVVQEITERKRQEADREQAKLQLQQATRRFELAAMAVNSLIYEWDIRQDIVERTDGLTRILGYSLSEAEPTGDWWRSRMHPEDLQRVQAEAIEVAQTSDRYCSEYRVLNKDNEYLYVFDQGLIVQRDQQGNPTRVIGSTTDITSRKRAELALRESEAKYRRIVETATEGIWLVDTQGQTTYVNQQMAEMVGFSIAEMLNCSSFDLVFAEDMPEAIRLFSQTQEILKRQFDFRLRCKDGSAVWANVSINSIFDQQGNFQGVLGMLTDVTDRRRAEDNYREGKQILDTIMAYIPEGVTIADASSNIRLVSRYGQELLGRTAAELELPLDQQVEKWNIYYPDGINRPAATDLPLTRAVQQGEIVTNEEMALRDDSGSMIHVLCNAGPIRDEQGRITGGIIAWRDISDRKQVLEALRRSEAQFRELANAMPQIVWTTNSQGLMDFVNQQWSDYTGLTLEQTLQPELISQVIHPDDLAANNEIWAESMAIGTVYQNELRIKHRFDQVYRWFLVRSIPIRDQQGQVIRWYGTSTDIEDLKQAQETMRQNEERYRYLAEAIPHLVWTCNAVGQCDYMNQSLMEYTGLSLDHVHYQGLLSTLHPDDTDQAHVNWRSAIDQGTVYKDEYRLKRQADGTYRWHLAQGVPLKDDQGQVVKWFGSFTDIDQQKQIETERARLLELEKNARSQAETANRIKDEFLAVLSHELRSPLNPIVGWSKLLRSRKLDEKTTARALETIERNAQIQVQLIEDLLDVSRILRGKLSLENRPVDLVFMIEAAMETVRLAAEAKAIAVQFDILEPCPPAIAPASPTNHFKFLVSGDSGRLQQIVWNLLSNAVKFTPEGGQVSIRLEIEGGNQTTPAPAPTPLKTAHALIQVRDTGKGIPPSFLPYVFDYFRQADATTTRRFGGLGLGLAIVHHLVELHGGTVEAESLGEDQGAMFTVRLPLMREAILQDALIQAPQEASTDQQRLVGYHILIVDDDESSRDFLAFLLEMNGALVTAADSAQAAIAALPQAQPDLVISDIGMPEVNGYMLIQQIRALPPAAGGQIPAIALTAYAGEIDQQQAIAAGFQRHQPKPLEPNKLIEAILQILQGDRPPDQQNAE